MKMILNFSLILLTLLSVGCTGARFVNDVSVFHNIDSSKKYKISFGNDSDYEKKQKELFIEQGFIDRINSIQHKSYEKRIEEKLSVHNFEIDNQNPDYVVVFSYFIDTGQQKTFSTPIIGKTGSTDGYDQYGVTGSSTGSYKEYTRKFKLIMFDINSNQNIFESDVISNGSSPQIQRVLPIMIDAMFDGFPRGSGENFNVEIYEKEKVK
jgi:hypothetical protein